MNSKIVIVLLVLLAGISGCRKCETCTPHLYVSGVLSPDVDKTTATVKLCDKRDIDAYESLTNLTDGSGNVQDTVRFICQ